MPKAKKEVKIRLGMNILLYLIVIGMLILSAGVGLIKINGLGISLIILGSGMFYIAVVVFAFKIK